MFFDITCSLMTSWFFTLILFLATVYLTRHYIKVRTLPPGPFPLPIVGNILAFKTQKKPEVVVESWRKIYGDIFTVWLGSIPYVVVCNWELIREALVVRKSDFSGRVGRSSEEKSKEGNEGILQCDYGTTWRALRKLSQSAIRKYSASDKLARIVSEVTDDVVDLMTCQGRPLDPNEFLELAVINILASSVFGKRYDLKDKECQDLHHLFHVINAFFGAGGNIGDFFPTLKIFYRKREEHLIKIATEIHLFVGNKLKEHLDTYQSGDVRDLTDALLAGREELQRDTQAEVTELNDANILMAICDIFFAGIQTTHEILKWTILLIANHQQIQERMRNEIVDAIGDRMPVQDDRKNCPFTMAVIMESLRFRPPFSFAIPHKAICDSQIGGYRIAKGTGVAFMFENANRDVNLWPDDPQLFRPERFLGRQDAKKPLQGFLTFGEGQRKCVGEKLAMADLFLIICRLFQRCRFELEGGVGSADIQCHNYVNLNICKPYKVSVTPNK